MERDLFVSSCAGQYAASGGPLSAMHVVGHSAMLEGGLPFSPRPPMTRHPPPVRAGPAAMSGGSRGCQAHSTVIAPINPKVHVQNH